MERERGPMSSGDDQPPVFGDLLRMARRAAGLTQEDLAERAGLSTRGISDLERGVHLAPHPDTVIMLMDALNLNETERARWMQVRQRSATRNHPDPERSPAAVIPAPLTPLVGREKETRDIGRMLDNPEVRLVTLTGSGGIGKTRLSIAVAGDVAGLFPAGTYFVSLAAIRDPALVVPAIARTLSINESGDEPLINTLTAFISNRKMLLLLDNFEQVLDASNDIGTMLERCSRLCVLVTSRMALRINGEHEYALPPMQVPDENDTPDLMRLRESEAIELFVQRAQAIRFGFDLTDANAVAVATICRRLDGLPLAIELAAARIRVLSPHDILSRLEQPLSLLTGGPRDLPDRQRTLRDTIGWSYELLNRVDQTLFRRLSAFVGGWTMEAVEAMSQHRGSHASLDRLTALVDANLVLQHEDRDGELRFHTLEMVREFGLEQLGHHEESNQVFLLHARYVLDIVTAAEAAIRGSRQAEWFVRLAREQGNIRAVLQRSLAEGQLNADIGRQVAVALVWYWFTTNQFREARDWLQLAVSVPGTTGDELWANASVGLGMMRWRLREIPEAAQLIERGLEVLQRSGDPWHTMFALHQMAHMADELGDPERAMRLFRESMQGYQQIGDDWGVAIAHSCLGRSLEIHGRPDDARSELRQAIEMFQELGDGWFGATSIHRLGDVEFACGHFDESARWYRLGLWRSADLGDEIAIADVLVRLGQIDVELQHLERAARLLGAARAIHDTYNMALFEPLRPAYEAAIATISASLGQARFTRRWEEGRRMSTTEAVDYALDAGTPRN